MKIVKYELSLVQKKELILTMEDNVDSETLLKAVKSIVRRVKNVWQLMKMYAVQSVNICVKLVGDVN